VLAHVVRGGCRHGMTRCRQPPDWAFRFSYQETRSNPEQGVHGGNRAEAVFFPGNRAFEHRKPFSFPYGYMVMYR
jgi:hypothetical protein